MLSLPLSRVLYKDPVPFPFRIILERQFPPFAYLALPMGIGTRPKTLEMMLTSLPYTHGTTLPGVVG